MRAPIKLITPPTASAEIQGLAVELLRESLANAESGNVLAVIIITKETDGEWRHLSSGTLTVREQVGALECFKHDLVAASLTKDGG